MELLDIYDENRNLTGRTHIRGNDLAKGDYCVCAVALIMNGRGQYLISKRTPNKWMGGMWEWAAGSVVAGEDSLQGALREAKEELGIDLDPLNGQLLNTLKLDNYFVDRWLFRQDVDLSEIVFQEGETCDAKWATLDEIEQMTDEGTFIPIKHDALPILRQYSEPHAFFPAEMTDPLYAVTVAKHRGKWVFVRHKDRDTLELAGGHIEAGESPEDAARRELREESGAKKFELWPVAPYSVMRGDTDSCGLLAFALIDTFDVMPTDFEMAERVFVDQVPQNLTYPFIVPKAVARAERWIEDNATTVYFVRHAEPDMSVHQDDIRPLTEAGEKAAEALVDTFKDIHLNAIYSSPYLRAEQTVLPLAVARHLAIGEVPGFRERKIGDEWIDQFDEYAQRQWRERDYQIEGGESLNEVERRNIAALEPILRKQQGKTVVVGTHGTALGTILAHYDPSRGYDEWAAMRGKMPWIVKLRFIGTRFVDLCEM